MVIFLAMILCGAFVFKMWNQIISLERAIQGTAAVNEQVTEGNTFPKQVTDGVRSLGAFNSRSALAFLTVAFGPLRLWGSICAGRCSAVLLVGTARTPSVTAPRCSKQCHHVRECFPWVEGSAAPRNKHVGIPTLQPLPSEG